MNPGPAVRTEADRVQLGGFVAGWELNPRSQARARLLRGAVLILIGVAVVAVAWLFLVDHFNVVIVLSILGVAAVIAGGTQIVSGLAALSRAGRQVFVFELGLVTARDDQVGAVLALRTSTLTQRRVIYVRNNVKRLEIDATLSDAATGQTYKVVGDLDFRTAVTEQLQRTLAAAKLQPSLDRLAHGGDLDFATIRLAGQGFTTPGMPMTAYTEVQSLAVRDGQWVITAGDVITTEVTGSVNDTVDFGLFTRLIGTVSNRAWTSA